MRLILLAMVFLACALIESPEDYAWMDAARSVQTTVEHGRGREDVFYTGPGVGCFAVPDVAAESKTGCKESDVVRF